MEYRDPKNSARCVRVIASHCLKRFPSLQKTYLLEDLEQEFWLVWMKAIEKFDSNYGVLFTTYLSTSLVNAAKAMAVRESRKKVDYNQDAVDRQSDPMWREDVETPEDRMIRLQRQQKAHTVADPRLLIMAEAMINPPDFLKPEDNALQAKAEIARSMGRRMVVRRDLTFSVLSKAIGFKTDARIAIVQKLEESLRHDD